jgi:hypothetical protein
MCISDGLLHRKGDSGLQLVVPAVMQKRFMEANHDAAIGGHFGVDRTFRRIASNDWWQGMYADVEAWAHELRALSARQAQGRQEAPRPTAAVAACQADATRRGRPHRHEQGPSKRGHKWMAVFSEQFCKCKIALPITDKRAETVARACTERVICAIGSPEQLLSDHGRSSKQPYRRRSTTASASRSSTPPPTIRRPSGRSSASTAPSRRRSA